MSRHRQEVAPRYGRITVLASSLAVTAIAVLGGTGVLPSAATGGGDGQASLSSVATAEPAPTGAAAADTADTTPADTTPSDPATDETATDDTATDGTVTDETATDETAADPQLDESLPADSGQGRRIVFSEGRQRVWLVEDGDQVARTYLVSGSAYDNLDPGSYEVYSRSEQAYGIDDSGTMKYFVRFTQGDNAAIGFHDIPIDDGKPVQTKAQLGTPLSHGCIRQRRADAIALWDFAPLGTNVVVTV